MTTVLDEAPKSVRVQNWWAIATNNPDQIELMLDNEDTETELLEDDAAARVIDRLGLGDGE